MPSCLAPARLADLRVDIDQLLVHDSQLPESGDLSFDLACGSLVGGDSVTVLPLTLKVKRGGGRARVIGLMAVTVGLAPAARGGSDRATPQIAQEGIWPVMLARCRSKASRDWGTDMSRTRLTSGLPARYFATRA
jgi:hypothetical protein